jgi:hypothetical protein
MAETPIVRFVVDLVRQFEPKVSLSEGIPTIAYIARSIDCKALGCYGCCCIADLDYTGQLVLTRVQLIVSHCISQHLLIKWQRSQLTLLCDYFLLNFHCRLQKFRARSS